MTYSVLGQTDDQILEECYGADGEVKYRVGYEVTNESTKRHFPIKGGLYDGGIFGVIRKCCCGTQRVNGRCQACGELVVNPNDQINHMGYIKLAVPYVKFIVMDNFKEVIYNILPGLRQFLKDIKVTGDGNVKEVTQLWNTEFILATPENESKWIISIDGVPYDVKFKEADNESNINNCGLNFLYRFNKEIKSLIGDATKLDTYINQLFLVAPVSMRYATWASNGHPNYPQLTQNYAYLMLINNLVKEMITGKVADGESKSLLNGAKVDTIDKLAAFATLNNAANCLISHYAILASSKESLVRYANTMRVPQSGRANIISADVEMDKLLLPRSLAYTAIKGAIINRLRDIYAGTGVDCEKLYENPTEEVIQVFEDIINDSVVVLNRQPTLHKYGMLAFRAGLWEKDDFNSQDDADKIACIGMNVMVCSPFNADFDGDQCAFYIFTESPDKERIYDKMSVKNNWFYEKTGDPIFVPENSILCGLHVGSKLELPSDLDSVKTYGSFDELKFDFDNKAIEFDTPILLLGEYTTYGIEAISVALGRPLKSVLAVESNGECQITSKNIAKIVAYIGALPDRIQIMNDLYKIGTEFVTYNGSSVIKLDELYKMQPEIPEVEEILKSDRSDKEKRHLLQDKMESIIKVNVKNLMPTLYEESAKFGGGGAKAKPASMIESFGPRIDYNQVENKLEVTNESLISGLSEESFLSHSIATRGILKMKASMVPMSGYITRQLVDLEKNFMLKLGMRSTDTIGIEVPYKDAVGRYKMDGNMVSDSEISMYKNTDKKVRIKSCIYTDPRGRDKWYVKADEYNANLYKMEDNEAIGYSVSAGTTEAVTQAALGLKHGGTLLKPTSDKFESPEDYEVIELGDDYMILGKGINRYWFPVPIKHIYTKEAKSKKIKKGDIIYYVDRFDYIDYNVNRIANIIGAKIKGGTSTDVDPMETKYKSRKCYTPIAGKVHFDIPAKLIYIGARSLPFYSDEAYLVYEGQEIPAYTRLCTGTMSPDDINQLTNNLEDKFYLFFNQIRRKDILSNLQILAIELMFRGLFNLGSKGSHKTIDSAIRDSDPLTQLSYGYGVDSVKKMIDKTWDPTLTMALIFNKNNRSIV